MRRHENLRSEKPAHPRHVYYEVADVASLVRHRRLASQCPTWRGRLYVPYCGNISHPVILPFLPDCSGFSSQLPS